MEINPVIVNGQNDGSAAGVMSNKILRRVEKIEALQWPSKGEFDPPRPRPTAGPTRQLKRERLVLSIKRHDGSELLAVYA